MARYVEEDREWLSRIQHLSEKEKSEIIQRRARLAKEKAEEARALSEKAMEKAMPIIVNGEYYDSVSRASGATGVSPTVLSAKYYELQKSGMSEKEFQTYIYTTVIINKVE